MGEWKTKVNSITVEELKSLKTKAIEKLMEFMA
jgi:hypothetical protein